MEKVTKKILLSIKRNIATKQDELEIAKKNLLIKCDNVSEKMKKASSAESESRAVEILQSVIKEIENDLEILKDDFKQKVQLYRNDNGNSSEF